MGGVVSGGWMCRTEMPGEGSCAVPSWGIGAAHPMS